MTASTYMITSTMTRMQKKGLHEIIPVNFSQPLPAWLPASCARTVNEVLSSNTPCFAQFSRNLCIRTFIQYPYPPFSSLTLSLPMVRCLEVRIVLCNSLVNVDERGRHLDTFGNRKAKTMCLVVIVIRVYSGTRVNQTSHSLLGN